MRTPITPELVKQLAQLNDVPIGDEAEAVAERLQQLLGFARELETLASEEGELAAVFDPRWERGR